MIQKTTHPAASINDIQLLPATGSWTTKSNGILEVLFTLNFKDLQQKFFSYEPSELAMIPTDIRGLRSYRISNLQAGAIGANEWHRLRCEIVTVTRGKIEWTSEDSTGKTSTFILERNQGIFVPAFILHTYKILEPAELVVLANTTFNPSDPLSLDSFTRESFVELQNFNRPK